MRRKMTTTINASSMATASPVMIVIRARNSSRRGDRRSESGDSNMESNVDDSAAEDANT